MCGIYGCIGPSQPNYDKLKILGIFNDERGGDSCGIFVHDQIKKSIAFDSKKVINWIKTNKMPYEGEIITNRVVIGHTRRKSTGNVTLACAHPFMFKDKNNKPLLVGVHNGTIFSWKKLLDGYNKKDIKDIDIDSQALLFRLCDKNWDVLEEYDGTVAAVWHYPSEPNIIYLFRGESRQTVNGKMEEERPLFYVRDKDKNLYFSSLSESLEAINVGDDVIPFTPNWVYKIDNGRIHKIKKIAREKVNVRETSSNSQSSKMAKDLYWEDIDDDHAYGYPGPHNWPHDKARVAAHSQLSIVKEPYEKQSLGEIEQADLPVNDILQWKGGLYYVNGHVVNPKENITISKDGKMKYHKTNSDFHFVNPETSEIIRDKDLEDAEWEEAQQGKLDIVYFVNGVGFYTHSDAEAYAYDLINSPVSIDYAVLSTRTINKLFASRNDSLDSTVFMYNGSLANRVIPIKYTDHNYEFSWGYFVKRFSTESPKNLTTSIPLRNIEIDEKGNLISNDKPKSLDIEKFQENLMDLINNIQDAIDQFLDSNNDEDNPIVKEAVATKKHFVNILNGGEEYIEKGVNLHKEIEFFEDTVSHRAINFKTQADAE